MLCGVPCMCIRQTAAVESATASTAPGACSASTSLTSPAPAAMAARITAGFMVSMETSTSHSRRSASITGSTRSSSCCSGTGSAPGRVDSPPTSMIDAPAATMARACTSAVAALACRPPSEKEFGVTLSTPMTTGRDRSSTRSAHCSFTGSGWRTSAGVARGRPEGRTWLLIRATTGSRATQAAVPAFRRSRRLAFHDLPDLGIVDGLVAHQRIGHGVQLVQVLLQDAPGAVVVGLDDLAYFLVDGVRSLVRNLLGLRDLPAQEHLARFLCIGER